jgi:hypothetical protein
MDDWRKPNTKIKRAAKDVLLRGFALSGRLGAVTKAENRTTPRETVQFYGHRVGEKADMTTQEETRLAFSKARPVYQEVSDLSYSENGMAWQSGRLEEKFSVRPIRLTDLQRRPPRRRSKPVRLWNVIASTPTATGRIAIWVRSCRRTFRTFPS